MERAIIITDEDITDGEDSRITSESTFGVQGIVFNDEQKVLADTRDKLELWRLPGTRYLRGEDPKKVFLTRVLEVTGYHCEIIDTLPTILERRNSENYCEVIKVYVARLVGERVNPPDYTDKFGKKFVGNWCEIEDIQEQISSQTPESYHQKFYQMRQSAILSEAKVQYFSPVMDTNFIKLKEFHAVFDNRMPVVPTAMNSELALCRTEFKVEELVEFLFASSNKKEFPKLVQQLKEAIDRAVDKVMTTKKQKPVDTLVAQSDALIDLIYFAYGSFVLLGVDPTRLFDSVHMANMQKLFPDGLPHYDETTHKVMKPENWDTLYSPEKRIAEEIERQKKLVQP